MQDVRQQVQTIPARLVGELTEPQTTAKTARVIAMESVCVKEPQFLVPFTDIRGGYRVRMVVVDESEFVSNFDVHTVQQLEAVLQARQQACPALRAVLYTADNPFRRGCVWAKHVIGEEMPIDEHHEKLKEDVKKNDVGLHPSCFLFVKPYPE